VFFGEKRFLFPGKHIDFTDKLCRGDLRFTFFLFFLQIRMKMEEEINAVVAKGGEQV